MLETHDLTVTVLGPQANTPIAGAEVVAILDRVETDGGYVVQQRISATTNASGTAVLSLWPNTRGTGESRYIVFAIDSTGRGLFEVALNMPAEDANLADVAGPPVNEIDLSTSTLARIQRLRDETVNALDNIDVDVAALNESFDQIGQFSTQAQDAATAASGSRIQASNSAAQAASSATSSRSASDAAAAARDDAQAAATDANSAATTATNAATMATGAATNAEQFAAAAATTAQELSDAEGVPGPRGDPGASAYDTAVANGFTGTQQEWLASLEGTPGTDGEDGQSAYQIAQDNGFVGTEQAWLDSLQGPPGADGAAGEDLQALVDQQQAHEQAYDQYRESTVNTLAVIATSVVDTQTLVIREHGPQ